MIDIKIIFYMACYKVNIYNFTHNVFYGVSGV